VDPSFRGQSAAILVRRGAIVVALEHVKAVITSDRVLLFNPSDPAVRHFLPELQRALSSEEADDPGVGSEEAAAAAASLAAVIAGEPAWPPARQAGASAWLEPADTPFEFRALSSVLDSVGNRLELRARALAPEVQSVITALQGDAAAVARGVPLQLVRLNTELARLGADVDDVRSALTALLGADDDLAGMYLSQKGRRSEEDHTEAEVLLESHWRAVEEAATAVEQLQDGACSAEGFACLPHARVSPAVHGGLRVNRPRRSPQRPPAPGHGADPGHALACSRRHGCGMVWNEPQLPRGARGQLHRLSGRCWRCVGNKRRCLLGCVAACPWYA